MAIAQAVKLSLRRHLWYLTQELVVFALFDNSLDRDVRSSMAEHLLQNQRPQQFMPGKPAFPQMNNVATLTQFIGPRSWLLFHLMGVDGVWLRQDPDEWENNDDYVLMRDVVRDLSVVNDAAERSVKDIQDYADSANDGVVRERIILVSSSHRIKLPKFLKNEMEEAM